MTNRYRIRYLLYPVLILSVITIFSFVVSCTREIAPVTYRNYPHDVGQILVNRCATEGCHDYRSKDACAGLDLSSWDAMFQGSRNNSCVIPYRPDQSFLLYSVNTFDDLGPKLLPTIPLKKPHLSRDE